jgi:hypothetical protein
MAINVWMRIIFSLNLRERSLRRCLFISKRRGRSFARGAAGRAPGDNKAETQTNKKAAHKGRLLQSNAGKIT